MTKAITTTYTLIHEYRARITTALLVGCALCIAAYAANVYAVISHTVKLGRIESQINSISAAVNDLDARYLDLSSAITPDTIASYGLHAPKVTAYIPRTPATAAATPSTGGLLAARGHEL